LGAFWRLPGLELLKVDDHTVPATAVPSYTVLLNTFKIVITKQFNCHFASPLFDRLSERLKLADQADTIGSAVFCYVKHPATIRLYADLALYYPTIQRISQQIFLARLGRRTISQGKKALKTR
jgi:hypothetical protein